MEVDSGDFENPSAKRQRTESPPKQTVHETPAQEDPHNPPESRNTAELNGQIEGPARPEPTLEVPGLNQLGSSVSLALSPTVEEPGSNQPGSGVSLALPLTVEEPGLLDALMQHVESEFRPTEVGQPDDLETGAKVVEKAEGAEDIPTGGGEISVSGVPGLQEELESKTETDADIFNTLEESKHIKATLAIVRDETVPHRMESSEQISSTQQSGTIAEPAVPISQAELRTAESEVVEGTEDREWESDSSPIESSSDSDLSSDSDSDEIDDYAMLSPSEQARILMAGDGGSDDEGAGGKKEKADVTPLRTANEKREEIVPKPDIPITPDMQIVELGKVEAVVESTVLIKAKISGEYQVLESGSLLCLADRSVVGVVAEPLGRVEQPMYTIRFTNDQAVAEAGLKVPSTSVFYVPTHSKFVFTQPLKAVKGSDASNFHDEEVGDDEMEFSDDEAEADHKRQMKMKRQGRRDDREGGGGGEGGRGRGRGRGGRGGYPPRAGNNTPSYSPRIDTNGLAYSNGSMEMNYDDVVPDASADEGYTPLARPANLNEMMAGADPHEGNPYQNQTAPGHENSHGRGRGRDRGRGDRGHRGGRGGGRGGRGAWSTSPTNDGNGNGGWRQPSDLRNGSPSTYHNQSPTQYQSFTQQGPMPPPSRSFNQNQYNTPFQQSPAPAPGAPLITPQRQPSYPPFSPSPISPLPSAQQQHFNFQWLHQAQNYQSFQTQNQNHMPAPGAGAHLNPAFMPAFNLQQPPGSAGAGAGWSTNQAAAAQVQAQLEMMRRQQQGGQ